MIVPIALLLTQAAAVLPPPAEPLPDDYRRLECGVDAAQPSFRLDMPTDAFLRRYRGDNRVLYMLSASEGSALDGPKLMTVMDFWPTGVSLEWAAENTAVHKLDIGDFDPETGAAPYMLVWDSTPASARISWMISQGTCTLVHEDEE